MTFFKHVLSYSVSNIITSSVPFLLLPILTVYLSPEEFGVLSLVQLLMVLSLPFVLLNIHGLFVIEYSNLNKDEFVDFVSSMLWIPLFGFMFLELAFWLFQASIVSFFDIPYSLVLWLPFFALMQSVPTMIPVLYQAKKEPLNYGVYKVTMTIANLALSILFVVALHEGWEGRLWGIVLSYILFSLIGLVILKKLDLLKVSFTLAYIKSSLKFGVPLIPHAIAGPLLMMSDRVFLSNMMGIKEVGIYSVAFQVAAAIGVITSSINQAWVPHLYEKLNSAPTYTIKKEIVIRSYQIMLFIAVMVLLFSFSVPVIFDIFIDSKYHEGKGIAIVIAVAFMFQGFYLMVTNYVFYAKKTHVLSILTLMSLSIVATLNYFLIPVYGMLGSAYAMLVVWFLFFGLVWFYANNVYQMPWFYIFKGSRDD